MSTSENLSLEYRCQCDRDMGNTGSLLDVVTYLETPLLQTPADSKREAELSSQLFKKPEKIPLPRISSDTTRNRPGHRATRGRNILEDDESLSVGVIPPSTFTREVPSPHKVVLSPIRSRRPALRQRKRNSKTLSSSSSSSTDELSTCSEDSQETKLLSSFIEDISHLPDQRTEDITLVKTRASSIPIAARYIEPADKHQTVTWREDTPGEVTWTWEEDRPEDVTWEEDRPKDRTQARPQEKKKNVHFQNRVRTPYSFARTGSDRQQQRGMVVPSDMGDTRHRDTKIFNVNTY